MNKLIKNVLTSILILLGPVLIMAPQIVNASPSDDACNGINAASGTLDACDKGASNKRFNGIIQAVVNILSLIVGVAAVLMIIIGGFRYIISGGDTNGVQGAKNTILYAIVGLVVVLFAQVIVRFVFSRAKP